MNTDKKLTLNIFDIKGFTARAKNCLESVKILTIADLVTWSSARLAKIRNMGQGSVNNIEHVVSELGLTLPIEAPKEPKKPKIKRPVEKAIYIEMPDKKTNSETKVFPKRSKIKKPFQQVIYIERPEVKANSEIKTMPVDERLKLKIIQISNIPNSDVLTLNKIGIIYVADFFIHQAAQTLNDVFDKQGCLLGRTKKSMSAIGISGWVNISAEVMEHISAKKASDVNLLPDVKIKIINVDSASRNKDTEVTL